MASMALLLLMVLPDSENWTEFRGSDGSGTTAASNLPKTWQEGGRAIRWKTGIHDRGWSSPVIWGNQIWLTTARVDGTKMFAVCVDKKSGSILRDIHVFDVVKPRYSHETNSYASCTPALEAGKVYVHFGSYGTACIDTETGKKIWERRDFVCEDFRGPGSSPIIHNELIIVHFDGIDVQFLVALNKRTGKTVWQKKRDVDYKTDNGDRKKAYSTPAVFHIDGRDQLISSFAMATIAYEPSTGDEIWRVRHGGMNAASRPIYDGELVFVSSGDGGDQLVAINPTGQGNVTNTHVVWNWTKAVPKRCSFLCVNGMIIMVNDKGVATSLDSKTGEMIWQKRIGGEYWSSPVCADGKIYCVSKSGRMPILAPSRTYSLVGANKLETGGNASIAISDSALFVRTATHLYRIESVTP